MKSRFFAQKNFHFVTDFRDRNGAIKAPIKNPEDPLQAHAPTPNAIQGPKFWGTNLISIALKIIFCYRLSYRAHPTQGVYMNFLHAFPLSLLLLSQGFAQETFPNVSQNQFTASDENDDAGDNESDNESDEDSENEEENDAETTMVSPTPPPTKPTTPPPGRVDTPAVPEPPVPHTPGPNDPSPPKKTAAAPLPQQHQQRTIAATTPTEQPDQPRPSKHCSISGPIAKNGTGLKFSADALIWQATEDHLTYAYKGEIIDFHHVRDQRKPSFQWDWGYRLALGGDLPRNDWDLDVDWTHMQNHANGTTNFSNSSGYAVWNTVPITQTAKRATAHLKIHLDQVDLDMGRKFYLGKHLSLHPHFGARSAWIFQTYNVSFATINTTQYTKLSNKFWGFGFLGGLDTDWRFTKQLSLYGNFGIALLMGFFDVNQKAQANRTTLWKQNESMRTVKPIFDLAMGLKWATTFLYETLSLTCKAGYEYHLYPDQNQFFLQAADNDVHHATGDLGYQGAILSIGLGF